MRRSNTFKIIFKNPAKAESLGKGCAVLWNKLNYKRRQAFFNGEFEWEWKEEYNAFRGWVGSATAQNICRKNGQAWKAFFSLLKLKGGGKLPENIKHVSPPGYWKDRMIICIRNESYRINGRTLTLPFKLKGRIKGRPRWSGKQGQLELHYDKSKRCWYAYQSIVTEPMHQPSGHRKAFVDFGVKYPITAVIEGVGTPVAYSGASMLSDWWYRNHQIAGHMSELKKVNGRKKSKQLNRLYCIRKRRFRQAVCELVRDFVERCHEVGVDEIVAGDLTGICGNGSMGRKTNSMVNNFWSHKYVTDRLRWTAENFGIKLTLVDERGTSSVCPRCGSGDKTRRGRLYKCKSCGLEAHRDVVGAVNIGAANPMGSGHTNWTMARPEVVNDFNSFHTSDLEGIPAL